MKPLTDVGTDILEWRAALPLGSAFELASAEGLHATLAWSDGETLATAETPEGTWTFKRVGVLGKRITLREAGAHGNLAEFHPHAFGRGRLAFRDGAAFDWNTLHHHLGWAFLDVEGNEMLRLQPWPDTPGHRPEPGMVLGRVVLEGRGAARWRDAFLAAFGWYLLLLAKHDAHLEDPALEGANLI